MAKATKQERKVEYVEKEISPESYLVELSADEAAGLSALLGYGVHWKTLKKLNLNSLHDQISTKVDWEATNKANPGFSKLSTHDGATSY